MQKKTQYFQLYLAVVVLVVLTIALFNKKPKVDPLRPEQTMGKKSEHPVEPVKQQVPAPSVISNLVQTTVNKESVAEKKSQLSQLTRHLNKRQLAQTNVLPKPEELTSSPLIDNSVWKVWLNTKAKLSRSPVTTDESLVMNALGFRIIQDFSGEQDFEAFNKDSLRVLYNTRMQRPGILTGTIVAQAADKNEFESCVISHQSYISHSFEEINTYFVESNSPHFNLSELFAGIKRCPGVTLVKLEILEKSYERK